MNSPLTQEMFLKGGNNGHYAICSYCGMGGKRHRTIAAPEGGKSCLTAGRSER